jgi:hypothetical protein
MITKNRPEPKFMFNPKLPLSIAVFLLLSACGDTPSDLGSQVYEKMTKQKESFESNENITSVRNFISNQDNWSEKAKEVASNSFDIAQNASKLFNPELAKIGIESSEMVIACAFTLLSSEEEKALFIDNLINSMDDTESKIELVKQIKIAQEKVTSAAIKKENCTAM